MKINIHEVQMGRRNDPSEVGGRAQRGNGIDTGRVQMGMGHEEPQAEPGLRQRVGRLFDDPQKRARQAAEAARLQATRARDEAARQRGLAEARNAIRQAAQGPTDAMRTPDTEGAEQILAHIALTDPKRARQLADVIGRGTLHHNMSVVNLLERKAAHEAQAGARREALREQPITSDIDWTRSARLQDRQDDGTPIRVAKWSARVIAKQVSVAINIASRPMITALNSIGLSEEEEKGRKKEAPHVLDAISLHDDGVHVSAPFHPNLPDVVITANNHDQFQIQTNPPPLADGVIGVLSMMPGLTRKKVLDRLPIGEVVVTHRTMGTIARVPAWYPDHLENDIKSGQAATAPWSLPIPDFKPIPALPDVLGRTARVLGEDLEDLPDIPEAPPEFPREPGLFARIGGLFRR